MKSIYLENKGGHTMPFEMIQFRDSDKIIRKKKLDRDVKATLEYVYDALQGSLYRGELLRQALDEMGWRSNGSLSILDGRRYQYKGFKKGIALEGSFSSFEYLLTGLARLQVGFDKKLIDTGILMLTAARSEKSSLGTSRNLAVAEVEALYPTISMPVSIALFDLGAPVISNGEDEGGDENGISVPTNEEGAVKKAGQKG
jgi:hypothetical protein